MSKLERTVTVELSRRDRLLLKRIADALDPVTEPKSGPRRLREPVLPTGNTSVAGTPRPDVSNVFRRLAGANEDSRVALTADEVASLTRGIRDNYEPHELFYKPGVGMYHPVSNEDEPV